jgi:hypothetical protein
MNIPKVWQVYTLILQILFCVLYPSFYTPALGQANSTGIFDNHADIGGPKNAGDALYDEASQTYTIQGAGYNIWFERDEFHYLYKKLSGDFILTANFSLEGEGVDPHRKVGWMVRESLDDHAAHISAVAHGDGLTVLQWRVSKGAPMRDPEDEIFASKKGYSILELERSGNTITMRAALEGEPLETIGSHEVENMPNKMFAGLFICSHNPDFVEEAKVWNVHIQEHPK